MKPSFDQNQFTAGMWGSLLGLTVTSKIYNSVLYFKTGISLHTDSFLVQTLFVQLGFLAARSGCVWMDLKPDVVIIIY